MVDFNNSSIERMREGEINWHKMIFNFLEYVLEFGLFLLSFIFSLTAISAETAGVSNRGSPCPRWGQR